MSDDIEHKIRGVGDETRVDCSHHKSSYGPHPDAEAEMNYCPYCGEDTDNDDHDISLVSGEVFCENTGMSTWRFCPGCGQGIEDAA